MKRLFGVKKMVIQTTLVVALLLASMSMAFAASDYFVYSNLETGTWGSYGVDGFKGDDGIDRIIFFSGSTAYIYKVTIPEGSDPNLHPSKPEATGDIVPRTFTLDKSFDIGVWPGHESEFYVDIENNTIYLGASVGIRKFVYDPNLNNYVFDSMVAPPSPQDFDGYFTQSLAYDKDNNVWYAGAIAWDNPKKIWKYDGNQGSEGTWELAFEYTPPGEFGSHHDGMEFINGYLYLADYSGDNILQYKPDGTLVNVFVHEPLNHELEGMGYGALGHFWVGSHGTTITEFGGGRLQDVVEDPVDPEEPVVLEVGIDIKPWSDPNSINLKRKGSTAVAILSSNTFDASTVKKESVIFAGVSSLTIGGGLEDANGDGLLDLVLHFDVQSLNLSVGDTTASLSGSTLDGKQFKGTDSVRILK